MAEDTGEDVEEWNIRFREDEEMEFFTELALHEAERWIQAVTRKKFAYPDDFRKSLCNGVLLCELLNTIKAGSVKRINKLPGAISGLDNINIFLSSCENNFGLTSTQLFDPADLEDLSQRAIADEDEELLKQEVDRRARNVAVSIFWLGKSVAGHYNGPTLDTSAFSSIVHSHGNKNIISDDCFKNDSWQQSESPLTKEASKSENHRHTRNSSYDSLGSYERESESSFDDLDNSGGTMPVRSDMKGDRRYGSTSSLNMNRDLRFSATSDSMYSDDKNDSMYQSSPNLSQGSHAHTRSSSTDSMDGYYGNHSRQSSGSTDNYKPSRLSSSNLRKSSSSTLDPLQFVKMKGADDLASAASKQMEAAREVNKMRGLVDTGSVSEEPDWQSNFNSWKTKRRKSASEKFFRVGEAEGLFGEEEEKVEKRPKTFGQIMADKEKRRSLGPMSFYPIEDDDSGIGGTAKPKDWSASKTENQTTESKPKGKKLKEQVAPWAHDSSGEADSQSDSETNNSHQSGDTDSVFSDKSTPSKVLSDDDSWVKARQNSHTTSEKMSTPIRTGRPLSDNFKLFQNNGNESQKKDEKKRVETPTNSAKKIKNITQAFEKKEKEAHAMPAIERHARYTNSSPIRKSFDNKSDKLNSSYAPPWKSLDLTNSPKGLSVHEKSLSPTSPKALVPKDQRYHPSSLKDHSLTGKENKLSQHPRSRYIDTLTSSQSSKTSALTIGAQSNKKSPLPEISTEPTKSKIAAAKEKFESTTEGLERKPPVSRKIQRIRSSFTSSESENDTNSMETNGVISQVGKLETTEESMTQCDAKSQDIFENRAKTSADGADDHLQSNSVIEAVTEDDDDNKVEEPMGGNVTVCEGADERSTIVIEQNISETDHSSTIDSASSTAVEMTNPETLPSSDAVDEISDTPCSSSAETETAQIEACLPKANIEISNVDSQMLENVIASYDDPATDDVFASNHSPHDCMYTISDQEVDGTTEGSKVKKQSVTFNLDNEILTESTLESVDTEQSVTSNQGDSTLAPENDIVESKIAKQLGEETDENKIRAQSSSIPDILVSHAIENDNGYSDKHYTERSSVQSNDIDSYRRFDDDKEDVFDEHSFGNDWRDDLQNQDKEYEKFTEKMIKINQKPNNDRGFGFFLVGGVEKKQPIIVQRVSLGSATSDNDDVFLDDKSSAADVCEVEANDELLSVNGRDVTKLTLAQVQGMVDHSVKRGQIELKIRRFCDDGTSMYESPMSSDNNLQEQSDGGFSNKQTLDDSYSYRPALQISTKTDDNNRLRLMDQLIDEKQREANNNQVKPHHYDKPPSPTVVEMTADVSFSSQVAPPSLPKTDVSIQPKVESPSPSVDIKDMSYPVDEILTEERKTISVRRTTDSPVHDQSPVAPRRRRTPVKQLEEVTVVDSPSPPTPPRADPPPLAQPSDTNEDSGFGPPAALMRWQTRKTRAKSEYQIPFSLDEKTKASHRLSSTLPYGSDFKFSLDKDYSKDDSMLNKVTQDFEETMTVSKPLNVKPTPYHFDDSSKMEAWQQKVDQQRMPDPPSPTSPIEMEIQMEEHLTAQFAAPARKVGQPAAPNLMEINVPYNDEAPMSPQEKFERDQRKIRLQYEEEKRRARDSEKQKQNQDKQVLNSDKLLRSMESQIQQTKSEAANQDLANMQPLRPAPTEPRFNSEPVTFRLQSNTPGRQLVIDPRNQVEQGDPAVPEYSFRVNLSKATNSGPPLRDLSQQQELSHEELLEREREKIREEEKRKFEEERQKWKEEQERELHQQQEKIRQERERLQREQELVEREKAMLEQKKSQEDVVAPRYQSINHHVFSPKSSSTGSPASSLSPHSPPSALEPKYGRDTAVKKTAPPPTAPKPEKKGRLTREDLLAMNRKATPMTSKPEGMDGNDSKESGYNSLREAPSKGELHSLNAVPRPKFRSSAAWIKDEEEQNNNNNNKEKPFVIGRRSDVIHQKDYSNPQDHWLVREAEKRRLADQTEHANVGWNNSDGVTAHAGVTKPSQSSLVNQFRGDIEPPPRNNRHYASSQIGTDVRSSTLRPLSSSGTSLRQFNRSPDSTGVLQFNAKTQQNNYASPPLAQTLPANFSFNANNSRARDLSSVPSKPPRSPAEEADPVIAVSGKQKCSHCGEELAGLKFSKV